MKLSELVKFVDEIYKANGDCEVIVKSTKAKDGNYMIDKITEALFTTNTSDENMDVSSDCVIKPNEGYVELIFEATVTDSIRDMDVALSFKKPDPIGGLGGLAGMLGAAMGGMMPPTSDDIVEVPDNESEDKDG